MPCSGLKIVRSFQNHKPPSTKPPPPTTSRTKPPPPRKDQPPPNKLPPRYMKLNVMHSRKVKRKWNVIAPEGHVFKCITVVDFGLAKSTRKRRSHKLLKSEKLRNIDLRKELEVMSLSKQQGCLTKMQKEKDLKTSKKTANHIEMLKGSHRETVEKFGKKPEDDQPASTSKKRNRDALSPPDNTDARMGMGVGVSKVRRMSQPNGMPSNLIRGKVKKLRSLFEKNEEDIQILLPKLETRLNSGFETVREEQLLIGQVVEPVVMQSNGRGGK